MSHRVYVVEDHAIVRETVCDLISAEADLEISGVATSGEETLDDAVALESEVILVDNSLPAMSGLTLIEKILERRPEARCLMFSAHEAPAYMERALAAGARGYVVKGHTDELLNALRQVIDGKIYKSQRPGE